MTLPEDPLINERNVALGAATLFYFHNPDRLWMTPNEKDRYRHMAIAFLRIIRVASAE